MLDEERARFSHPDVELGEIVPVRMDGEGDDSGGTNPPKPKPPPVPKPPEDEEPIGP